MNTFKTALKVVMIASIFMWVSDLRAATGLDFLNIKAKKVVKTEEEQKPAPEKEPEKAGNADKKPTKNEKTKKQTQKKSEMKKDKKKFRLDVDKFLGFLGGKNKKLDKILGFIVGIKKCIKKVEEKRAEAKTKEDKKKYEVMTEALKRKKQKAVQLKNKISRPKSSREMLSTIDNYFKDKNLSESQKATLGKITELIKGMPTNNPMVGTLIKQFVLSIKHCNNDLVVAAVDDFIDNVKTFQKTDAAVRNATGAKRCELVIKQTATLQKMMKDNNMLLGTSSARKKELETAARNNILMYSYQNAILGYKELDFAFKKLKAETKIKNSENAAFEKTKDMLKTIKEQLKKCSDAIKSSNSASKDANDIQKILMATFSKMADLREIYDKHPKEEQETKPTPS